MRETVIYLHYRGCSNEINFNFRYGNVSRPLQQCPSYGRRTRSGQRRTERYFPVSARHSCLTTVESTSTHSPPLQSSRLLERQRKGTTLAGHVPKAVLNIATQHSQAPHSFISSYERSLSWEPAALACVGRYLHRVTPRHGGCIDIDVVYCKYSEHVLTQRGGRARATCISK